MNESIIDNGSEDLFSSLSSNQSIFREELDITLQLNEFVWVQCDNADCQKWRRVPNNHAEGLGEKSWYCSMNQDADRNMCSAPEEDTALYDRIAKKAGIKYVMSTLEVGALVWAKVPGYCRWPGIVSRCPDTGVHVWVDIDGDPTSYHVEFLGRPHSHCWASSQRVQVYGHKETQSMYQSQHTTRGRHSTKHKRGRKPRLAPVLGSQGKNQRTKYKHTSIEDLISEADFLLKLIPEDRLKYIQFHYKPPAEQYKQGAVAEPISKQKKRATSCECGAKEKYQQKLPRLYSQTSDVNHRDPKNQLQRRHTDTFANDNHKRQSDGPRPAHTKQNMQKWARGKKLNLASKVFSSTDVSTPRSNRSIHAKVRSSYSVDEGISVASVKTEVSSVGFDSPNQFSQSQLRIQNSMVGKSKEEKFTIDIGMYSKNEKAFEHDVRRYMSRLGERIRSTPVWNNVPIRLFQLFLSVHERGGFVQVTKKKQWTAVYKELTEQHQATNGVQAKKYYERNLYPYELYISGQELTQLPMKRKRSETKHKVVQVKTEPEPSSFQTHSDHDSESYTKDIEAILEHLDEEYDNGVEETIGQIKPTAEPDFAVSLAKCKTTGVALKFHDETTGSPSLQFSSLGSEFNNNCPSTDSRVQEVPQMADETEMSLSSIEDKILHEMRALEDDMKQIIGDLQTE